ncbi:GyrI-like domain-containing protein [Candidatus Enterococcus clewellii]|uniref:AraC effector-binding domain-containing protein n=1 Tax=Candidatus Enterococcus clewellii TaxID=1834193 RepID=A0A242KBZ2_9ENTE|nr:effector binding domain-containing protein [Enterococcus sp. 9E7_DIV0242]OTP18589.1 hypothetical protein A5888_000403 [Enterococcus sp. 9E7_DIV0242]
MKSIVDYEVVFLKRKVLMGLSSDVQEETPDMELWGAFYKNFYEKVPNRLNEKVYEVYSSIDSHLLTCQVTIGCEVANSEKPPKNAREIVIPAGNFAKFTLRGNVYEIVPNFWKQLKHVTLPFERSYSYDFEEYPTSETDDVTVSVYLGIQ